MSNMPLMIDLQNKKDCHCWWWEGSNSTSKVIS